MFSLTRCAVAIALMLCATGFSPRVHSQTKSIKKGSVLGGPTLPDKQGNFVPELSLILIPETPLDSGPLAIPLIRWPRSPR